MAEENESPTSRALKALAEMDYAADLTFFELMLMLHDAKVIDAKAFSQRLIRLADRQDLKMPDGVRRLVRINAEIADPTIVEQGGQNKDGQEEKKP